MTRTLALAALLAATACTPALGRYSVAVNAAAPTLPPNCAETLLARGECAVTVPRSPYSAFANVEPNTPITRMRR